MFCELQQDYGIDFVSRIRDENLEINGHIQRQLAEPGRRWGIENQGFRSLSQTWNLDRPASHSFGAVLARLVFVFMIYNASHLFEKQSRHRPDYAEHLRRLRSYGSGLRLAGATNIALTESGFCCAISTRDLLRLQKQRIKRGFERALEAGRSLTDVLRGFDSS